jgi:hypothetical protein
MCVFSNSAVDGIWDPALQGVTCTTPPAKPGAVRLTASTENAGDVLFAGEGVVFTYYPKFTIDELQPSSGPVRGGTEVVVNGQGIAAGLGPIYCRLGNLTLPATMEPQSDSVRCVTPAISVRNLPLELSLNGQQYETSGHASFSFYSPPAIISIMPESGSILGSTLVTITGVDFLLSSHDSGVCRWGELTTNLSSINETHFICKAPAAEAGRATFEVSMNGQQFTDNGFSFSHYADPHVVEFSWPGRDSELDSWLEPSQITSPHAELILVRVWGSAFMGGSNYRCRINSEEPIAATYDSSLDCIMCWSDLWVDGINTVEVTLNGVEYTTDNTSFAMNKFW